MLAHEQRNAELQIQTNYSLICGCGVWSDGPDTYLGLRVDLGIGIGTGLGRGPDRTLVTRSPAC